MATLYDLEKQLAALKDQRSSGVAKVSYGGRSVEYRSVADIDRAIAILGDEVSKITGQAKKKTLKTYASKGL